MQISFIFFAKRQKTKLCPYTFFTRKNKDRRSLLGEQDAAAFAI